MFNKGKILVRVRENPEKTYWRKPDGRNERIVIDKATKRSREWAIKYSSDCLIPIKKGKFAVECIPYAKEAIHFTKDNNVVAPILTQSQARRINFLEAFHARYKDIGKNQNSMALLILGILVIANIAITVLMVSGRLRI